VKKNRGIISYSGFAFIIIISQYRPCFRCRMHDSLGFPRASAERLVERRPSRSGTTSLKSLEGRRLRCSRIRGANIPGRIYL